MASKCTNTAPVYPPGMPVLADVITDLQRLSGRYDLTDAEWIRHINDAQRRLDRLVERAQQRAQNFYQVPIGTTGITFSSRCRVIDQVWVVTDCERLHLERIHPDEMHDYWTNGDMRSDYPCAYTEAIMRHYPGPMRAADMEGSAAFDETVGMSGKCNGIIIWPSVHIVTRLEIVGSFYDDLITDDWPYSWWLINHEDLVKKATLRELEVYMRNSQGTADYDNAISLDLSNIDLDDAEQKAVHIEAFYG